MSSLASKFGGGPYTRGIDCALPAHYSELQALCDALGHAAQQEMANAIALGDEIGRERAYGKWLGVRDCTSFGLPEHVRIACRLPEQCAQLVELIAAL
jgi:histidinol-phosphate/aromatic aminotransferase/cobyric acid decarboxylase-like protein